MPINPGLPPGASYGKLTLSATTRVSSVPAANSLRNRRAIAVQNRSEFSVWAGWDNAVDDNSGWEIPSGGEQTFEISNDPSDPGGTLYLFAGLSGSDTAD